MSELAEIVLQNPNRYPEVRAVRLRPWLARLLAAVAPGRGSLGVRFCSDREMRRVNLGFRNLDKTTDVLSFPGEDDHVGDILISIPTARRQAAAAYHGVDSVELELKTLLLHGVLHCLGYDHETDDGEMGRVERRLRRTWLRPDPEEDHGDA
ncbi:MAG TPA: rRNA maturation RNase YbeY [Thermoanaerobaculia bacterium]|nr:rRNA maturation RNase YbeY [Thermoanaerobaculia bacterium]